MIHVTFILLAAQGQILGVTLMPLLCRVRVVTALQLQQLHGFA
jgi:hypothetical protein